MTLVRPKELIQGTVMAALGAFTLAGWGGWAYTSYSSTADLSVLQNEAGRLQSERDELAAKQVLFEQDIKKLNQVRLPDSSSLEQVIQLQEINRQLRAEIEAARAETETARAEMLSLKQQSDSEVRQVLDTDASSSSQSTVIALQSALAKLGFGPLASDGVMGPNTKRAVEAFQRANGLPPTGELDSQSIQKIEDAAGLSP